MWAIWASFGLAGCAAASPDDKASAATAAPSVRPNINASCCNVAAVGCVGREKVPGLFPVSQLRDDTLGDALAAVTAERECVLQHRSKAPLDRVAQKSASTEQPGLD